MVQPCAALAGAAVCSSYWYSRVQLWLVQPFAALVVQPFTALAGGAICSSGWCSRVQIWLVQPCAALVGEEMCSRQPHKAALRTPDLMRDKIRPSFSDKIRASFPEIRK